MGERLAQARELAGYDTARRATDAHGFVYSTYMNHEGGHRDFSRTAARYAAAYRVNLNWLLTGKGAPRGKEPTHPVLDLYQSLPPDKQAQAIDYLAYLRDRRE